jgi:hypothetical protein
MARAESGSRIFLRSFKFKRRFNGLEDVGELPQLHHSGLGKGGFQIRCSPELVRRSSPFINISPMAKLTLGASSFRRLAAAAAVLSILAVVGAPSHNRTALNTLESRLLQSSHGAVER